VSFCCAFYLQCSFYSTIFAGETYEFALNRNLFTTLNENHSILLIFEDDIEFIEHFNIKVNDYFFLKRPE
jgi:hypothetical protein